MGILDRDRLFFSQKAKLIELTNEYRILDESGAMLGVARQEGQSKMKKALRFVSRVDQFLTHHIGVYEEDGTKVLALTRPAKIMRSKIIVEDADGSTVGTISQQNVFGRIRFEYADASGKTIGGIKAENWRAWNFSIVDEEDREIGRITKKWAGAAKELFTTADNYVYEIAPSVQGPLRLLALASAAGVDLALKQDD